MRGGEKLGKRRREAGWRKAAVRQGKGDWQPITQPPNQRAADELWLALEKLVSKHFGKS